MTDLHTALQKVNPISMELLFPPMGNAPIEESYDPDTGYFAVAVEDQYYAHWIKDDIIHISDPQYSAPNLTELKERIPDNPELIPIGVVTTITTNKN